MDVPVWIQRDAIASKNLKLNYLEHSYTDERIVLSGQFSASPNALWMEKFSVKFEAVYHIPVSFKPKFIITHSRCSWIQAELW